MNGLDKLRPWIAALFGVFITGAGHLFLRRWRRASVWIALAISVVFLFVPESARVALLSGGPRPPLMDVAPALAVTLVSALDAFLLGVQQAAESSTPHTPGEDAETVSCPQCGREIDAELDFCHWCTVRFDEPRDD
ncbi:zinc ribbon domain-containing protein [Haloferax mucosum]|nr:zinc ribbon domain-containing protein [Haloferax mucosum]